MKRVITFLVAALLGLIILIYATGFVIAYTEAPKTVSGPVSWIDQEELLMTVKTAPHQGIQFSFSRSFESRISKLSVGDPVTVVLGYTPDLLMPLCRTYRLQDLKVISKTVQ